MHLTTAVPAAQYYPPPPARRRCTLDTPRRLPTVPRHQTCTSPTGRRAPQWGELHSNTPRQAHGRWRSRLMDAPTSLIAPLASRCGQEATRHRRRRQSEQRSLALLFSSD